MDTQAPFAGSRWRFRPRLLDALAGYDRIRLLTDVGAGLTVGIIALSLCVGFGIASGATPAAGLYSGIIGGFIISALGGTRVQIGGPAGAFVGLVALMVAEHGMANLLVCTMIAGIILVLMGAFRLGTLIRFIPHPVTVGFTCGIAVTILTTQISALFGLHIAHEPAEFLPKMRALGMALPAMDWLTVGISAGCVVIIQAWPKRWSRVPGAIIAVIVATVLVSVFHLPVETIGTKYGGIPRGLPPFAFPSIHLAELDTLIRPAFTIALLGAIESLLSAVVADGLIDDRHDSNQELMAQGIANFVAPMAGGLPVTGVIARTAANIRLGGLTPVSGMVHALVLLAILLVAAPLATNIPLASLAAVLAVVALRMGDWEEFAVLRKRPKSDGAVFVTTFVLTVVFDLTVAVEVGMILAAFLFIKRIADTTQVHAMAGDSAAPFHPHPAGEAAGAGVPRGVVVYRVFGALMFGSADKLDNILRRAGAEARVVVLHLEAVTAMDATALNRIESLHEKLRHHHRHLVLCGPHTQPYHAMELAGFFDALGRENVCADLASALVRARELAALPPRGAAPAATGPQRS